MRTLILELDGLPSLREAMAASDIDLPAAATLAELAGVDAVRLPRNAAGADVAVGVLEAPVGLAGAAGLPRARQVRREGLLRVERDRLEAVGEVEIEQHDHGAEFLRTV